MEAGIVSILVQAGGIGISCLLILIIGQKLDKIVDKLSELSEKIVDHKARNNDTPYDGLERRKT